MKKYIKKPVEIEAVQWTGFNPTEIKEFAGDYIIKGVKGEFYPCRQDIFEQTYEEVCS